MTVERLIEELKKYDKDLIVVLDDVIKCECEEPDPVKFSNLKHTYCCKCENIV
tara:strand:+ start:55 stop:213 length:159 start_codon:yes stop_codon:yes gene_type:complete